MESPEFGSVPGPATADSVSAHAPVFPDLNPHRRRIVWTCALVGGIAAGLVSWGLGEFAREAYKPELFKVRIMLQVIIQATAKSQNEADRKNATLSLVILGCATGLAMGFAGGLASGSPRRAVITGLGAGVIGCLVALLAARALLPLFYRHHVQDLDDLLTPMLAHGGMWVAVGAVGGLAFAIGMGRARLAPQAAVGACIGAFLGAVVYHLLSASLFPDSGSIEPTASLAVIRLLSRLPVAVLIALGAAMGALSPARAAVPAPDYTSPTESLAGIQKVTRGSGGIV